MYNSIIILLSIVDSIRDMYMIRLMKLIGYEDNSIPYRKICLRDNENAYHSFNAIIRNDQETRLDNDVEIDDRLNNPMKYAEMIINRLVELRENEDNEKFAMINCLFDLNDEYDIGEYIQESIDDSYDDERRSLFYKAIEKALKNILSLCNRKEELYFSVNEAVAHLMSRKDHIINGRNCFIGNKMILIIEAVCVSID